MCKDAECSQHFCIERDGQIVYKHVFDKSYGHTSYISQLDNGLIILSVKGTIWSITNDRSITALCQANRVCTYGNYVYYTYIPHEGIIIINMENYQAKPLTILLRCSLYCAVFLNNHHILSDGVDLYRVHFKGELCEEKHIEGEIISMLGIEEDKIVISTQNFQVMILDNKLRILATYDYSQKDRYFSILKFGNRFITVSSRKVRVIDMTGKVVNRYSNHGRACCKRYGDSWIDNRVHLLSDANSQSFASANTSNATQNCIRYWRKFEPNMTLYK